MAENKKNYKGVGFGLTKAVEKATNSPSSVKIHGDDLRYVGGRCSHGIGKSGYGKVGGKK